jgi:hypothetical protein
MGWEMVLKNQAENINLLSLLQGRQKICVLCTESAVLM